MAAPAPTRPVASSYSLPTAPAVAAVFSIVTMRRALRALAIDVRGSAGFQVVVWVTLLANAAICANLAAVFSRYRSRVSWLLPLAAIATLVEWDATRQVGVTPRLTAVA